MASTPMASVDAEINQTCFEAQDVLMTMVRKHVGAAGYGPYTDYKDIEDDFRAVARKLTEMADKIQKACT